MKFNHPNVAITLKAMFDNQILRKRITACYKVMENPYMTIVNLKGFGPIEIFKFWWFSSPTPPKDVKTLTFANSHTETVFSYMHYSSISMWNRLLYKSSTRNPYSIGSEASLIYEFLTDSSPLTKSTMKNGRKHLTILCLYISCWCNIRLSRKNNVSKLIEKSFHRRFLVHDITRTCPFSELVKVINNYKTWFDAFHQSQGFWRIG